MSTKVGFYLSLILFLMVSNQLLAGNDREGIKYYKCGLRDHARLILLQDFRNGTDDPSETCYYLGELYYAEHKPDSALFYYKEGMNRNIDNPFNLVGQGKVLMATDVAAAEKMFSQALSGKNKKDALLQLAVAKAYAANHSPKAGEYLAAARAIDEKCAGIYVYEGDRLREQQKNGEACGHYEQAVYFDPFCTEAYVKYARLYARINPQIGLDMLQKLEVKEPGSAIAALEMADIYYINSRYGEAARAYEKCVSSPFCTTKELSRYATVLFYYNDYSRSLELAGRVLSGDPDNVPMLRISFYDYYGLKKYPEGISLAETFFKKVSPSELVGQDYLYYGRLLLAGNQMEQAIPQLEKALSVDSFRTEVYLELGKVYEKQNKHEEACRCYDNYIRKESGQLKAIEYFAMGRCHYFAGNALDSSRLDDKMMHFQIADSLFGIVSAKVPDNYLGYFWKARANSAMDPDSEKGLAKPYYEQALVILSKDEVKYRNLIIECSSYLGYYHYIKNEFEESKACWNRILVLDPENDVAKKALAGIK